MLQVFYSLLGQCYYLIDYLFTFAFSPLYVGSDYQLW